MRGRSVKSCTNQPDEELCNYTSSINVTETAEKKASLSPHLILYKQLFKITHCFSLLTALNIIINRACTCPVTGRRPTACGKTLNSLSPLKSLLNHRDNTSWSSAGKEEFASNNKRLLSFPPNQQHPLLISCGALLVRKSSQCSHNCPGPLAL